MSGSLIGQLRVVLGMETATFESGSKRARHEMGELGKAAKEVRGLISGMFAAFAIEALGETIKRSIEHVAALGEQAKALGISTRALQEYRYVAGQTGMTIEQTDKFLGKLSKTMGDARNGAEAPRKAFEALSHVLGTDILKSAKGVGDAIPMISDALNKVEDPTRRASLAAALLGRSWRDAGALLALGSEGINRLRESAHELGIVLSEEQIQNAEETAHKLKALHDVLGARIDGAVAANAHAILGLASALTNLAAGLANFWSKNPRGAMAILGALAGARFAGIPGALVGGVAAGFATSDTPESLRAGARAHLVAAQALARGRGYRSDMSPAEKRAFLRAPQNLDVLTALTTAQDGIRRAKALEASSPLSASETPAGTETPPEFLKGGGSKHHGSDHAEQRAKEAERLQYELDRQSIDEKQQLLEAQRAMTTDTEDRNALGLELLQVEHDQKALEIDHNLKMVELDKTIDAEHKEAARAQAAKSKALNDQLLLLRTQGANLQAELAREAEAERTDALASQLQTDRLKLDEDLATTARKRRDIELELLDLAYEQRKQALQHTINDQYLGQFTHNADDRTRAQMELDALNRNHSLERERVMRSTAGPLEQMLQSLPTTADQINEALQAIDVQAIGDINDGLTEAAARFIKLGGVAGRVLQDIFSGVMKILLAKYLDAPIAGLLGKILNIGVSVASAGSGGGGGGFKDTSSLPKFAAGGSLAIGGMGGVDANLLSINGVPRAMVDRSERLDVVPANDRGGGRGGITVHVHQSNNFAGGAATMEDVVKIAGVTKQATIGAVMDMKRRGAFR